MAFGPVVARMVVAFRVRLRPWRPSFGSSSRAHHPGISTPLPATGRGAAGGPPPRPPWASASAGTVRSSSAAATSHLCISPRASQSPGTPERRSSMSGRAGGIVSQRAGIRSVMNAAHARRLFALANAFKEGDLIVGGTRDDRLREDARRELLTLSVGQIRRTTVVDDGVSEALERGRDRSRDGELDALTIARLKEILLTSDGPSWTLAHREALPSEAAAAVAKVMTN